MSKKLKRMIIWIPSVVLAIFIIVIIVFIFPRLFKSAPVLDYLQYGGNLRNVEIYDKTGTVAELDNNKYKLVFFVASDCGSCIKELPEFSKFQRLIAEGQPIQFMLLWEDEIPTREVEQYGLEEYSYSLNNVRIASTFSTAIMADKENNIIFVDGSGFDNTARYLFESDFLNLDSDILIENSNNYIRDNYTIDTNKDTLVYFSLPGCPDCAEATPIVYGDEIGQTFEIVRIEADKAANSNDIIDKHAMFENIYGIDWYPSFLILEDDSWRIIREVELSSLRELLLAS